MLYTIVVLLTFQFDFDQHFLPKLYNLEFSLDVETQLKKKISQKTRLELEMDKNISSKSNNRR